MKIVSEAPDVPHPEGHSQTRPRELWEACFALEFWEFFFLFLGVFGVFFVFSFELVGFLGLECLGFLWRLGFGV